MAGLLCLIVGCWNLVRWLGLFDSTVYGFKKLAHHMQAGAKNAPPMEPMPSLADYMSQPKVLPSAGEPLLVAAVCIALYWPLAPQIMHAFIHDEQTVALGTVYLRARCFAPIMMFLCFHMVHYMQALGKGGVSLALAAIRQLGMNIPLLFLLDHFFGMTGIIWTQVTADALTAVISYLIYAHVKRGLEVPDGTKTEST